MHRTCVAVLLLGLFLFATIVRGSSYSNGVSTSKQSYFFGAKDVTDILCFSKTLVKGSNLPQDVSFTNPTAGKNIKFVTFAADRYSSKGFTADISSGAVGTTSITIRLNGKSILPYAIEAKFYCVK
ncbi:uncharacterized protein LOC131282274 [Anopheles ziemanni]|uniref:uncharacterized protein LOC131266189 n=1 Tax=Anopheles coustani TaxID=139045 RepID=UPI0026585F31|nr:uncharacterized protein LOC131266189 [Anopheles coustani]XP_058167671.1 uncharacterized protein LOC131282274 [Anopheles ziemanni]